MTKIIDCLIIGNNEMNFEKYVENIEQMDKSSGAFRDLNLNFIKYENKPYNVCGVNNLLSNNNKAVNLWETFSATIAYLGTYIHRANLTFDYINSFQEEKGELIEKLKNKNIKTIAITTTLYVSVFPIIEIMNFIKQYNNTAKIIVGGPFVTTQFRISNEYTLKYLFEYIGADFYINSSQGEAALVEIIRSVKENLPVNKINNIYYRNNGGYINTSIVIENNVLSENMVDWSLFANNVKEYTNIRTAISCPFSCAFCGFPEHAGKYQTADITEIEQELKELNKIETIKSIFIVDDTFNVPKERFKGILKMMIKNKFRFKWYSHFRCQFADEEIVKLMKESGCEGVFLGIESGSDKILKNMNKAVTVEQYRMGIKFLKKYGIITQASFIIGFPGETIETVQETINFIEESGIDFYRAQLWYCDTITPIYKKRDEFGIKGSQFEWSHTTMDSKRACDLIDEMMINMKNAIRLPSFFDLDGALRLKHILDDIDRVKLFLNAFNEEVKKKIINPSIENVDYKFIDKLQNIISERNKRDDSSKFNSTYLDGEADNTEKYLMDFEFNFH